ncbi:hypothetical protein BBO99_00009698 [Phytophthora kernoviae]|uniref:Probable pectate lyase F n=1 Tax=Phytophthora kernoviae TaxID=325452 RepID=A0A421GC73_9STRA|nr:hypothetical protein BBO99_00009698 [Phytophthora kernoviae]
MVKIFTVAATFAVMAAATTSAASVPDGTWPTSTGSVQYSEAYTVKAGEIFDGKMQTFERSDVTCEGQTESGKDTAVFLVEAGGTLKNAIIGKNQMEGVHCDDSDCTIENVCIVTVNENNGDEATLSNIYIKADDDGYTVCAWSQATDGDEPTELGDGIKDPLCQYSESDINVNGDVSTATSTTSNSTSTSSASTTVPTVSSSSGSAPSNATTSTTQDDEATNAPVSSSDDETQSALVSSSDSDNETTQETTSTPSVSSADSNDDNEDDKKKSSDKDSDEEKESSDNKEEEKGADNGSDDD